MACWRNRVEAVRALLSANGIDLEAPNDSGKTALYYAASRGDAEITRMLLVAGAAVSGEVEAMLGRAGISRGEVAGWLRQWIHYINTFKMTYIGGIQAMRPIGVCGHCCQ